MIQLMKLELLKLKWKNVFLTNFIITLSVIGFLLLGHFATLADEGVPMFNQPQDLFLMGDTFFRLIYGIYAGVVISQVIVNEYATGMITTLFTYPISRLKIMAAKLTLIFIYIVCAFIAAELIYSVFITVFNSFVPLADGTLSWNDTVRHIMLLLPQGMAVSGIGLSSLYFGMRKKSAVHTIVSAVIISTIINSNMGSGNSSLFDIMVIPALLCAAGVAAALLTSRKIITEDL